MAPPVLVHLDPKILCEADSVATFCCQLGQHGTEAGLDILSDKYPFGQLIKITHNIAIAPTGAAHNDCN